MIFGNVLYDCKIITMGGRSFLKLGCALSLKMKGAF